MKSLGTVCGHPPGTHEQIAGARNPDGSYKSRATAEYPSEMCSAIADIISPLCSPDSGRLLDLSSVQQYIPIKQLSDLPVSYEDGGGLFSEPDWSRPFRAVPDTFQSLRRQWVKLLLNNGLIQKNEILFHSGDTRR